MEGIVSWNKSERRMRYGLLVAKSLNFRPRDLNYERLTLSGIQDNVQKPTPAGQF